MKISSEQIEAVAALVAAYIREQRDNFFSIGRALNRSETDALRPFFGEKRLSRVRVYKASSGELPNPEFYPAFRQMGFTDLPDFSRMAAITFIDAIAFREEVTLPVLFHEFVHVIQYELLGAGEFAARYVKGFLSGRGYEGIPLERNAYKLDARFSADHNRIFDVEAEVRRWKDSGRF